ncbi:hypothetical protein [Erythrobacter sp. JK5]|uniref:hypothetical protein n=1 Tax=Erythrobacter sp. JK5 TaxID=2829500 RepID=UPI001BAE54BD|nr:hypothetical protein [Erythrobacter sp. JK5]QUL38571.1 hypothetical protein KDC96_04015 [Erythrobacter sp. JK5]
MTDHPSTFRGGLDRDGGIDWDDRASLHRSDSAGMAESAGALRRGSFSEMIRHLARLPEQEREKYVIEKAGDRRYSAAEAAALALRDDFPAEAEQRCSRDAAA